MSRSILSATRRHPFLLICGLVVAALAIQFTATGNFALAHTRPAGKPTAHTPVAPPGPGPVSRPPPSSAQPNHGLPAGQRPPVVPPGITAGGKAHKLSAGDWAKVRKPGRNGVQPKDGPPPSPFGAQNLLLRPGFALGDTSLVLYFDAADPGVSSWSSWLATVFDPDTGSAQDSKSMSPSEAMSCGTPRTFCHSFGVTEGWSLVGDHGYFVTITVTLKDGTQAVSLPSGTAKARAIRCRTPRRTATPR